MEFSLYVAEQLAITLIDMFNAMSRNKETAEFLCARIRILQGVLSGFHSNLNQNACNMIGQVMQESYDIFQQILRRNTIKAFLLSLQDKADIERMGGRLDACIQNLGMNLAVDQVNMLQNVDKQLESFKQKMNSLTMNRGGQVEGIGAMLTNPMAKDFYLKYFVDNSIIPTKCIIAALEIEFKMEIQWNIDVSIYLAFLLDPKNTGQLVLDEFSRFFDTYFNSFQERQKVAADSREFSAQRLYGPPYNKTLYLEFAKVSSAQNQIQAGDKIRISPLGFNEDKPNRLTLFGTHQDGVGKADILFSEEDFEMGKLQSQIVSKSSGYYISELSSNGMTRIKITRDTDYQLYEGMIICLGLHQIFYVESIDEDFNTKQMNKMETLQMNRLGSVVDPVAFDEEALFTVEMPAFIPVTKKLTLKCITGDYEEQQWVLDPTVSYIGYQERGVQGFSIARGNTANPRDIIITNSEVSGVHGLIKFAGQNWYYNDLGSSQGSWLTVSTYDELKNFGHSQQRKLADGDTIRISSYLMNVEIS